MIFKELFDIFLNFIKSRVFILAVVCALLFSIIVVRLFNLQIKDADSYVSAYNKMSERTRTYPGVRGNIYDRDGNLLAYNVPTYSVIMEDKLESSDNKSSQLNEIIYKTVSLIEKYGDKVIDDFAIVMNSDGTVSFSDSISENSRLRFLKDVYGTETLDTEEEKRSEYSAQEVFEYLKEDYYKISEDYSDYYALKICMIRYNLSLNAFQKYLTITIAKDVSDETVAAIYESESEIPGVTISEDTNRVYTYGKYYSHILGYVGRISESQMTEWNKQIEDEYNQYTLSDMVGKSGIEYSMELTLRGNKGYEDVFVDSMGKVISVNDSISSTSGNDVYLTIDSKLQVGIYHLIEQNIASLLLDKIVNRHLSAADEEKWLIPIWRVYFQMINNNVVDLEAFDDSDSTENEKYVHSVMSDKKQQLIEEIKNELYNENAAAIDSVGDQLNEMYYYIYTKLSSSTYGLNVIPKDRIDTNNEIYIQWMKDKTSLREILKTAIENNWVDVSKLELADNYSDGGQVYDALVNYIIDMISNDKEFTKIVYKYLVFNGNITGSRICMLLYDQEVLDYDADMYNKLASGRVSAFDFMCEMIRQLKITPAMIALETCSAQVTVVDSNSGDVLAVVSYPSYDNNLFSGYIDSESWTMLNNDLSKPLLNRATMTRTAPGSTFKPVSSVTGLEENIITPHSTIHTTGIFTKVTPSPKCWCYPGSHGTINVVQALRVSCNYFYYSIAYDLACRDTGNFDGDASLAYLRKYGEMFGLTEKSGVEIEEYSPIFSDENAIASYIGQGTHNFTSTQLARYVNTIASDGVNYELTLLSKILDYNGNPIPLPEKSVKKMEVSDTTIETIQAGMKSAADGYNVIGKSGHTAAVKTGTAQENPNLADHAVFIAYTPADEPEISINTVVQHGYTSSYAADITYDVMKLYYGDYTLEQVKAGSADGPLVDSE